MMNIKQLWHAIIAEIRPQKTPFWHKRYVQIMAFVIFSMLGLTALFLGYGYYSKYRNEQAQRVLAACLEEYVRALGDDQDRWSTVEMSSRLGYEQYKRTALAPYFLGLQAEALLHQEKRDEASTLMKKMMQQMPTTSPVYYLYKIKEYLINLDASDASTVQAAIEGLSQLAQEVSNPNKDCALYYIGNYYALHDNMALAQEYWQKLADDFPQSPWTESVIAQLRQLV